MLISEHEKLIDKIINELPLKEKAKLLYGDGNWIVRGLPQYNISPIWLSDGPHGLRKEDTSKGVNLGNKTLKAVCFPSASLLACSWDKDITYKVGGLIAIEAKSQGVNIVLGPGLNIKRNPRNGRNFEYYSEDPLLSGVLAGFLAKGLQDNGVGACLKHFAVNNQETNRMLVNAVVDHVAMNNLYLKPFKIANDIAHPYSVMCSYNKLNGFYNSDNKLLLRDTLKKSWGFEGLVMSDWGATNQVSSYKFGLDLDMPRFDDKYKYILKDVKKGKLTEKDINEALRRVLRISLKLQTSYNQECDYERHHLEAGKISENCIVLAKNDGILPLNDINEKIAVIGHFALESRYQGGGSSHVNSYKVSSFLDYLEEEKIPYEFAEGYSKDGTYNYDLIKYAKEVASNNKKVILFIGTTENIESEGYDRKDILLPESHYHLYRAIKEVNENIIVIIQSGAPVELKDIISANAILISYLGGENVAYGLKRIIYGETNPSGRLPETWPLSYLDNPFYQYFPGDRCNVFYKESIYVGYRYFDKAGKNVLFPFGHGLSYSNVKYSNAHIYYYRDNDEYELTVDIKNFSERSTKEVIQIYLNKDDSKLLRPKNELFLFKKEELLPFEEKTISFTFKKEDLRIYDIKTRDFVIEGGEYNLKIAKSVNDLILSVKFAVISDDIIVSSEDVIPSYYHIGHLNDLPDEEFAYLYQSLLPEYVDKTKKPFTLENSFEDIRYTFFGKLLYLYVKKHPEIAGFVNGSPLRNIAMSGFINQQGTEAFIKIFNGKIITGLFKLLFGGLSKKKS